MSAQTLSDIKGTDLQVGDIIWWNNFSRIGRISQIVATDEMCHDAGVAERGIFLCIDLLGDFLTNDIYYRQSSFRENEIEILSHADKVILDKVTRQKLSSFKGTQGKLTVSIRKGMSGLEIWDAVAELNDGGDITNPACET